MRGCVVLLLLGYAVLAGGADRTTGVCTPSRAGETDIPAYYRLSGDSFDWVREPFQGGNGLDRFVRQMASARDMRLKAAVGLVKECVEPLPLGRCKVAQHAEHAAVGATLDRIERSQPELNAFITIAGDEQ